MKTRKRLAAAFTALALLLCGCAAQEAPVSSDVSSNATSGATAETSGSAPAPAPAGESAQSGGSSAAESSAAPSAPAPASSAGTAQTSQTPQPSPAEPAAPPAAEKPAVSVSAPGGGKQPVESGSETPAQTAPAKPADSALTEDGSGREGTKATGSYNYGEALQKSLLFYELQRSGDIDESTARTNWRGDSGMSDGADAGLDLTGGLYDAGDNVKFNLPMAYTAAMLAWSVYEDKDAYEKSGQLEYALGTIKWVNDYLIKCHPEPNVYYYQVGDGNKDHSWWGAAEVMQMERPSFKVDLSSGGSTVAAEAAASLAACAAVFADVDAQYSAKCLKHAKELYSYAETVKSDSGYTAANGFYNSWSGFYDELTWAAMWLYNATGESGWLDKAKQYEKQCGGNYKWTMCWDDKYTGAVCLLANATGDKAYRDKIEKNLDWWTTGTGGERVTYSPKGLAWLDSWGSLRYATTAAFIAAVYAEGGKCPADKAKTYEAFCESQVNYALGSSGRSYVVGYGENAPQHPHHRTAQGSWSDNMNEPANHRHTLYGALVGGPDASDSYADSVSDYNKNEVADDYNAGFTGALAKLYKKYGGQTIKDFGAVEPVGEELYAEQRINAQGGGFMEIKAMVYNKTAWPARVTDDLELRYFVDLSELYSAGKSAGDVKVTLNYSDGAKFGGIYEWDKANHIYYVSIDFSGAKIYPGGQSAYRKEVQFRMLADGWNADNDPSFAELVGTNGSELVRAEHVGLYEGGTLVFGREPNGSAAPKPVQTTSGSAATTTPASAQPEQKPEQKPSAQDNGLSVALSQQQTSGAGNTIQFTLDITNNTGADIDLSKLELDYFFTKDKDAELCFWCDHSALTSGTYTALTDSVKGAFSAASGKNADTKCAITFGAGTLSAGGSLTLQARITRADWTDFDLGNDYSAGNAEHILIKNGTKTIFGKKP